MFIVQRLNDPDLWQIWSALPEPGDLFNKHLPGKGPLVFWAN